MDTREKIIHSAYILFLENGYKSTTYNELVKSLQMSKGAFYHYFKNKEELFHTVIDTYFSHFFDQVNWKDYQETNIQDLKLIMNQYYQAFSRKIAESTDKGLSRYFILFFEAIELYPDFRKKARYFYTSMKDTIEHILNRSHLNNRSEKTIEKNKKNASGAIDIISHYEGGLFWLALFPETKLDNLF